MSDQRTHRKARAFFRALLRYPKTVIALSALITAAFATQLPRVRFDNRPDSFLPPGHEALEAKKEVERVFDLKDPMILALLTDRPGGVFSPEPLRVLLELSRAIETHLRATYGERCPPRPVYSLATEFDVEFSGGLLIETPFLDPFPTSAEDFARLREHVFRLELYNGVIISEDGQAAGIIVIPPPEDAGAVYRWLREFKESVEAPGMELVLSGEAAVRSAMGESVVEDAVRLNPVCAAIITLFLFLTFRNLSGILLPLAVVSMGCIVMLGSMIASGKPVYIITNAILVTVMSLGVADAIHVQGEYYNELRRGDFADRNDLVSRAMSRLWLPIVCTSVTDMVSFVSFFLTGSMPPFQWFGFFTAVGIAVTLTASLTLLPSFLVLFQPALPRFEGRKSWGTGGWLARALRFWGRFVHRKPDLIATACGAVVALAIVSSFSLRLDQSLISTFDEENEVVVADRAINRFFHGTYFLDVLFERRGDGDLLEPAILQRIEELEAYAKSLPTVNGAISVAGFAAKMNQIMNDWDPAANRLPDDAFTVREHFDLLDSSPSKKASLLRVIREDYRQANTRLRLSSGWYHDEKVVVEAVQRKLAELFPTGGSVSARLAGRVNLDYHWVRLVFRNHVASVACTLAITLLLILVFYRSLAAALLCLLPVVTAVLATYGLMALLGVELSIGTSMFASLAIGVGVNFPIHLLHRLRTAVAPIPAAPGDDSAQRAVRCETAFAEVFSLTGKAIACSAAAICFGFLALVVSDLPLLRHFGLMIAAGIGTASLASLSLLPAVVAWWRPRWVYGTGASNPPSTASTTEDSSEPGDRTNSGRRH